MEGIPVSYMLMPTFMYWFEVQASNIRGSADVLSSEQHAAFMLCTALGQKQSLDCIQNCFL